MRQSNSGSQVSAPAVSALVSRSVTVDGHRTSVRLEPVMWTGLQEICRRERSNLHEICSLIAALCAPDSSLTAAIRVFIMAYFRAAATDDGHRRAGHGNGIVVTLPGTKTFTLPKTSRR